MGLPPTVADRDSLLDEWKILDLGEAFLAYELIDYCPDSELAVCSFFHNAAYSMGQRNLRVVRTYRGMRGVYPVNPTQNGTTAVCTNNVPPFVKTRLRVLRTSCCFG